MGQTSEDGWTGVFRDSQKTGVLRMDMTISRRGQTSVLSHPSRVDLTVIVHAIDPLHLKRAALKICLLYTSPSPRDRG